jgi:NADH dehydrogenase [ubiquinone] 1 alpha subcomplex assembly factor 1
MVHHLRPILVAALVAVCAFGAVPGRSQAAKKPVRLSDFSSSETNWRVVNDTVMGGVSSAKFTRSRGIGTFSGRVRLDNNGGFASVRSQDFIPTIPETATSMRIRMRGDGRRYQVTIDTDLGWFWFSQPTVKGKWTTVDIPFDGFEPVSRFGEPTDREKYRPETHEIAQVGILISNKRQEQFSLDLDWIEAR